MTSRNWLLTQWQHQRLALLTYVFAMIVWVIGYAGNLPALQIPAGLGLVLVVPGLTWSRLPSSLNSLGWMEHIGRAIGISIAWSIITVWLLWLFGVRITAFSVLISLGIVTLIGLIWPQRAEHSS